MLLTTCLLVVKFMQLKNVLCTMLLIYVFLDWLCCLIYSVLLFHSIPLTVEWSVTPPHDYLLAGCHDGTV